MRHTILFSVILCILCGCQSNPDYRTDALREYLNENHKKEIPENESVFVVLPKNSGCSSCKKVAIDYLNKNSCENTHLICSEEEFEYIKGKTKCEVLIDTFGDIESYNLCTQNVALIKTKDRKVQSVIPTEPEDIRKLLAENIR